MRSGWAGIALVLLTSCSSQLASLKQADFSRDDFASALAREYRDYADSESEQGRAAEAERFAAKGLAALSGLPAEPDAPKSSRGALQQAKKELSTLLTDDNKRYDPDGLARAQVLFDCWASKDEHGLQAESDGCASEFRAVVDRLKEELG
jgi:hypothetical protein